MELKYKVGHFVVIRAFFFSSTSGLILVVWTLLNGTLKLCSKIWE